MKVPTCSLALASTLTLTITSALLIPSTTSNSQHYALDSLEIETSQSTASTGVAEETYDIFLPILGIPETRAIALEFALNNDHTALTLYNNNVYSSSPASYSHDAARGSKFHSQVLSAPYIVPEDLVHPLPELPLHNLDYVIAARTEAIHDVGGENVDIDMWVRGIGWETVKVDKVAIRLFKNESGQLSVEYIKAVSEGHKVDDEDDSDEIVYQQHQQHDSSLSTSSPSASTSQSSACSTALSLSSTYCRLSRVWIAFTQNISSSLQDSMTALRLNCARARIRRPIPNHPIIVQSTTTTAFRSIISTTTTNIPASTAQSTPTSPPSPFTLHDTLPPSARKPKPIPPHPATPSASAPTRAAIYTYTYQRQTHYTSTPLSMLHSLFSSSLSLAKSIVLPALIGATAGIVAAIVGLAMGTAVAWVWSRSERGRRQGQGLGWDQRVEMAWCEHIGDGRSRRRYLDLDLDCIVEVHGSENGSESEEDEPLPLYQAPPVYQEKA